MSMTMMLLMFLPMLLVILFLNRSQSKKQREIESKLKKGDRVVTTGGLVGRIVELGTRYAKIEIAPGVKIQVLKSAIHGLDSGEEPSTSKDGGKSKTEASDKDASGNGKK